MRIVKVWLPLAFAISVITGLIYVTGQQVLRQTANDPQIQMAQDWAEQINGGTLPKQLDLGMSIDPTHSLAPFGVVYDTQGKVVATSYKTAAAANMPDGVFVDVDKANNNETHFTWEPSLGNRFAVVVKKAHGADNADYYVLAGRNLRESEHRQTQLLALAAFAWLVALAGSFYLQTTATRGQAK